MTTLGLFFYFNIVIIIILLCILSLLSSSSSIHILLSLFDSRGQNFFFTTKSIHEIKYSLNCYTFTQCKNLHYPGKETTWINHHEDVRLMIAGCQTKLSSLYSRLGTIRNVVDERAKPHCFLSSGSQVTCQSRRPVTLTTLSAKSRSNISILTPCFLVGHWPTNTLGSASPMYALSVPL